MVVALVNHINAVKLKVTVLKINSHAISKDNALMKPLYFVLIRAVLIMKLNVLNKPLIIKRIK